MLSKITKLTFSVSYPLHIFDSGMNLDYSQVIIASCIFIIDLCLDKNRPEMQKLIKRKK